MRCYLRCPGAICCPARRALRAVLQPHPVLRRADRRRVEPTAPRMLRLSPPAGCGGCSVRGKRRRCLRVRHRCFCAFPRGRSTGLGVAGFAIRSRRGRHRPRASPRSPNGPIRARMKPPDSPAATRSKRMAWGQVFRGFGSVWEKKPTVWTRTGPCGRGCALCAARPARRVLAGRRVRYDRHDDGIRLLSVS